MFLTDEQWAILELLITKPKRRADGRGRPRCPNREVLSGILWILRTEAAWPHLPYHAPPHKTCHRRFQKRVREGVMRSSLEALARGTKIMAISDASGLPLGVLTSSVSPHEVTLVHASLDADVTMRRSRRLIEDRALDSDSLDQELDGRGLELIAPHRSNRVKQKLQDCRKLRRYRRRGKIERLFAWLENFRRITT